MARQAPMIRVGASTRRARVERAADWLVPPVLSGHREQLQYLGIGAWNTVFGYGVWAILHYLLSSQLHYLLIVVLSYPIAITNAYLCYRYIVFRSHGPVWREVPRFSAVYLLTLVANLATLPLLLRVVPLSVYGVQALFTALVVVASYLAHRSFSFRAVRQDGAALPTGPADRLPRGE